MIKKYCATFVLSTGRCGTQWLSHVIQKHFADQVICTHEPIDHAYHGREHLGHHNIEDFLAKASDALSEHIAYIKEVLLTSDYIETGHTCWSVIQYFQEIFRGQIKVVWITRHPMTLAKSWMTHGVYAKPILPHESEKVFLLPSDKSVAFASYQSKWDDMNQIEKILYYWLEVNTHAYRLLRDTDIDHVVVKFEDLFQDEGMMRILDLADLRYKKELQEDYGIAFRFSSHSTSEGTV